MDHLSVESLLRLNDEPYVSYTETQIHRAIMSNAEDFMELLERFYLQWGENENIAVLPHKQVFSTDGLRGDFRVMPCVLNYDGKLIKVVKVIGTNEEERIIKDKISVGKALLVHPTDNHVQAIFDVCSLSSFRTAAVSALAFKYAGHARNGSIGIVGAGRIGFYTALFLHRWIGVDSIDVCDISGEQIARFMQASAISFPGLRVRILPAGKMFRTCSALFLATTSAAPIVSRDIARDIGFISSVGADADNLSEMEGNMLEGRHIAVDSRQSMLLGDLKRWLKAGLIAEDRLIELRLIVNGNAGLDMPVLFVSTGVAVQDALACGFLFDCLGREAGFQAEKIKAVIGMRT